MYKHILVATDLTPESDKVVERAMEMRDRDQAEISIVHVVNNAPLLYGGGEFALPIDTSIEKAIHDESLASLNKQAKRWKIDGKHCHILVGSTTREISHLVKEISADLVVLGSHDHYGFSLIFGSTANSLLNAMHCDTLAIKV